MRGRVSVCCPMDLLVLFRIWDIGKRFLPGRVVRPELLQSHPERGRGLMIVGAGS